MTDAEPRDLRHIERNLQQLQEAGNQHHRDYNRLDNVVITQEETITELRDQLRRMQAEKTAKLPGYSESTFRRFSGEDPELPFSEWFDKWELFAQGRNWTEELKLTKFPCYLAGDASDYYRDLTEVVKQDYEQLQEQFVGKYDTVEAANYLKNKFYGRKMNLDETVSRYAHHMRQLARGAFPGGQSDLLYWFIEGLRDPLKDKVKDRDPQDFDDALSIAKKLESRYPAIPNAKASGLRSDVLARSGPLPQVGDKELAYSVQAQLAAIQPSVQTSRSLLCNSEDQRALSEIIQSSVQNCVQSALDRQERKFEQILARVTSPRGETASNYPSFPDWNQNSSFYRTEQNRAGSQRCQRCNGFNHHASQCYTRMDNVLRRNNNFRGPSRRGSSGNFGMRSQSPQGSQTDQSSRPPTPPRRVTFSQPPTSQVNAAGIDYNEQLTGRFSEIDHQLQNLSHIGGMEVDGCSKHKHSVLDDSTRAHWEHVLCPMCKASWDRTDGTTCFCGTCGERFCGICSHLDRLCSWCPPSPLNELADSVTAGRADEQSDEQDQNDLNTADMEIIEHPIPRTPPNETEEGEVTDEEMPPEAEPNDVSLRPSARSSVPSGVKVIRIHSKPQKSSLGKH